MAPRRRPKQRARILGAAETRPLVYTARIALDAAAMTIDGRIEPLRPGMAVTAEIRTGSRRILDYLLSPLRQSAQEALRER